ncbi:protein of unknown function UPF0182 [Catenulispora acidiphila DSM 44928]|uniref:Uncharacterized protein n=1 Tax=Catenulispora acidiphila (strain DSM 44928 / JCM 14897 / NBRC 102108 / NRRL B-24433 / ID139908) TaxID=479433 RepID=C7QFH3_CATAD|nr:protein of unknown function UPF0182 [Catenulispora acidiphila DSM 44928]
MLAITIVIMAVLITAFLIFDSVYTSYLWYHSVGAGAVYRTRAVTEIVLFLVFGALMALVVGTNIWLAHRFRPPLTGVSMEQQALDRYRMGLAPFQAWLLVGASAFFGIAAGASASGAWRTYLMWADSVSFGTEDPQFHKDVGFYVFTLPWLRHIQGFMVAAVLLSLLAALFTHYLFAGVALTPPAGAGTGRTVGSRATRAAQVHISVLLGCLVLVKAYAYWLDRYSLTVDHSKITNGWTGPTYKDVHAVLPAKTILLVIAVLCALLFFGNALRLLLWAPLPDVDRGGHAWALPALGVSLMVLASVVIGGVYPLAVQQLQVDPSQSTKEAPYIQRNIDATRTAYGLNDVETQTSYVPKTDVAQNQLAPDAATVAQIPVMDPSVASADFNQQQSPGNAAYYHFPDPLTVDRYQVGGKTQDTLLGVRGLKPASTLDAPNNWVDDHLKYTHGYGLQAAAEDATAAGGPASASGASAAGSPDYLSQTSSDSSTLGSYQPRVYFGPSLPDYSIVGAPPNAAPAEFDYPDAASPTQQQSTTYAGKGGVPVDSVLTKLLYAVKFHEPKILLSNGVNKDSRIMYDRDPGQRVREVAPWLTVDGTTYPVAENGRILWVVDGYTTTAAYPYSTTTELSGTVNYVRNAVKATVDAYDGTVTLYAWDDTDPILKTWMKAFPGTVKPRSAISPDLLTHLRYPQDLFNAQRDMLGRYHVTQASEFSAGSSFWNVPADPTKDSPEGPSQQPQSPYYVTLQMPHQGSPTFSLAGTLTAPGRAGLAAFMAVDSDPQSPDYGKIRILSLPTDTKVPSPEQVQNTFRTAYADQLTTPKAVEGNLLTLPVGGGLLYVEPVYVPLTIQTPYPVLKGVMVAFGDDKAFEPTLQLALDKLFAGKSGAVTGENPLPQGASTTLPDAGTAVAEQLKQAINDAAAAQDRAVKALSETPPDWTAFGVAETEAQQALKRAQDIENAQTAPK